MKIKFSFLTNKHKQKENVIVKIIFTKKKFSTIKNSLNSASLELHFYLDLFLSLTFH